MSLHGPQHPVRILIVEDSMIDYALQRMLILGSYDNLQIQHAETAEQALAAADQADAIIIDKNIGTDDGLELAAKLHARNWRQPKMILSGHESARTEIHGAGNVVDWIEHKDDIGRWVPLINAMIRAVRR